MPTPVAPPLADIRSLPQTIKVLILDDQQFDRHRLTRLCSVLPLHTEITNAASLAALETALDSTTFDLIFVDYNLPDGSGLDALDRIRDTPRNARVATIMVTGQDEELIALKATESGCADYVTKDELSPASFSRAVTNALQKSRLTRQVADQTSARGEAEGVLHKFANQCANDIKPLVSRMMRQLRDMRDAPSADHARTQRRRDSLEASCMPLWDFLEALESHQVDAPGEDLAATSARQAHVVNDTGQASLSKPLNGTGARSKRPPSPFSRSYAP